MEPALTLNYLVSGSRGMSNGDLLAARALCRFSLHRFTLSAIIHFHLDFSRTTCSSPDPEVTRVRADGRPQVHKNSTSPTH